MTPKTKETLINNLMLLHGFSREDALKVYKTKENPLFIRIDRI